MQDVIPRNTYGTASVRGVVVPVVRYGAIIVHAPWFREDHGQWWEMVKWAERALAEGLQ